MYALKFNRSVAKRNDVISNSTSIGDSLHNDDQQQRSTSNIETHSILNRCNTFTKSNLRSASVKHEYFEPCQMNDNRQINYKDKLHMDDADEYYKIEFNEASGIKEVKKCHTISESQQIECKTMDNAKKLTNVCNNNNNNNKYNQMNSGDNVIVNSHKPPAPIPPKRMKNAMQKARYSQSVSPQPMKQLKFDTTINPIKNHIVVSNQSEQLDGILADSCERLDENDNKKLFSITNNYGNNNDINYAMKNHRVSVANSQNIMHTQEKYPTEMVSIINANQIDASIANKCIDSNNNDDDEHYDIRNKRKSMKKNPSKNGNKHFPRSKCTWHLNNISNAETSASSTPSSPPTKKNYNEVQSEWKMINPGKHQPNISKNEKSPHQTNDQKYQSNPKYHANSSRYTNQYSIDSDEFSVYTHTKKYAIEMI